MHTIRTPAERREHAVALLGIGHVPDNDPPFKFSEGRTELAEAKPKRKPTPLWGEVTGVHFSYFVANINTGYGEVSALIDWNDVEFGDRALVVAGAHFFGRDAYGPFSFRERARLLRAWTWLRAFPVLSKRRLAAWWEAL